jgi:hypothetical protein
VLDIHTLSPPAKIKPKWITDHVPNVRNKTVKLLEENVRVSLHDIKLAKPS